jgi:hypothetical protein
MEGGRSSLSRVTRPDRRVGQLIGRARSTFGLALRARAHRARPSPARSVAWRHGIAFDGLRSHEARPARGTRHGAGLPAAARARYSSRSWVARCRTPRSKTSRSRQRRSAAASPPGDMRAAMAAMHGLCRRRRRELTVIGISTPTRVGGCTVRREVLVGWRAPGYSLSLEPIDDERHPSLGGLTVVNMELRLPRWLLCALCRHSTALRPWDRARGRGRQRVPGREPPRQPSRRRPARHYGGRAPARRR